MRQADCLRRENGLRTSQSVQPPGRVQLLHSSGDDKSQAAVLSCRVVEPAMRLYMAYLCSDRAADPLQRSSLITERILQFSIRQLHGPTSKSGQVRRPGVDSDTHTIAQRQIDATAHGLRIASMKPAGDVCRRDQRKDLFVRRGAVNSKTFAEVTIDINADHRKFSFWQSQALTKIADFARAGTTESV